MKPVEEMMPAELAAFVATHLAAHGINVVLSGGACVLIHSDGKYVSYDLDFVREGITRPKELRRALQEIGFVPDGRYFRNPSAQFFLDFHPPPAAVGSEPIGTIETMHLETGHLRILSPTDCVKDRLAIHYYFSDEQALSQALFVAESKKLDMAELERWSRHERQLTKFRRIRPHLDRAQSLHSQQREEAK